MNIRVTLISIFILIAVNVLAQNSAKYLVEISLSENSKLNELEDLKIPVIHFTEESLITLLPISKLNKVEELNINFRILDEKQSDDRYYLVSSTNQNGIGSEIAGEQIIFKGDGNTIVKNLNLGISDLIKKSISILELNGVNLFKNERFVLPKYEFGLSDSTITHIVSAVNPDSVRFIIQSLQNFGTRFLNAPTRDSVAGWIKSRFLRWGYTDVVIDSFEYSGTWQKNVVATLPGVYTPDKINIVGGHHDSYSSGNPMVFAPGADDNASGTSAVLEIARVLKETNYQPESTIKFITFAAEEYGLWGSKDYALKAYNSGMDISIMINHDMISHTNSPVSNSSVDINYYTGFEYLRELAMNCTQTYSLLSPHVGGPNSSGSDSHSFWQLGFPSVYFEERDFSPFYHSPADTIGNYSMEFCAEVIKSSCATLLSQIVIPALVKNYRLVDGGDGNSLALNWSASLEPDLDAYKIYIGNSTGIYDSSFSTLDTSYIISGLTEGTTYYVGVSAYDFAGNESIVVERNAMPLLLPLPPSGFSASPQWHKVMFDWSRNKELDLYGYNLYRSETGNQDFIKINQSVILDTVFTDDNIVFGRYYYYLLKAVDNDLNESSPSVIVKSMAVSLDKGILVIDETKNGNGNLFDPTDEQVDQFYDNILSEFYKNDYDIELNGEIKLADIGAYSTIIWQGNDYTNFSSALDAQESIKQYLDFGGNFLYTGFSASRSFQGGIGMENSFAEGDFIYDYFKIDTSINKLSTLFISASPISGSNNYLYVDSSKSSLATNYHIRKVESISSNTEGINIYIYNSNYDSTTIQGSMQGLPIGVEYIGQDYKSIVLNIPLYYMNQEQAKTLVRNILLQKFNEPTSVKNDEQKIIPMGFELYQNYPNPFNPSTTIKFALPVKTNITLSIYNALGEKVTELFKGEMEEGYHEIMINTSGLSSRISSKGGYASGVYFYKIESENFNSTKKMILLK